MMALTDSDLNLQPRGARKGQDFERKGAWENVVYDTPPYVQTFESRRLPPDHPLEDSWFPPKGSLPADYVRR